MSYSSLESRLSGLPTILAGPILRRVEANSVTVWLASKEPLSNATLEVRNSSGGGTVLSSPASSSITLGKNLHLLVLAATSSSPQLLGGVIYVYDVVFGSLGGGNLTTPGILAANDTVFRQNFCYAPFNLPSFRLPASVPNLKIVQGSCRKPHGGKTDALRGLDSMLEAHSNDGERPQILVLTGDQVYADDVADTLLFMLMDSANTLLKWGLGPVYNTEGLPGSPTEAQLAPGARQNTVASHPDQSHSGELSSGYAKSHLISLGEFYAMYLFSWADTIWPSESDIPEFTTIYGTDAEREARRGGRGRVPEFTVNTPLYQRYLDETRCLRSFLSTLRFVRRALANISTYMIFDDHEVSDDWFLTREWVSNTLSAGTLSRRIIQNGIAAYAVFQAWGNTPSAFGSGDGRQLLNLLSSLEADTGDQNVIFNNIGDIVLPTLQNGGRELSGSRIDWHYNIEFDDFRLVVLDTRTQRGFPSDTGYPALLNGSAISSQLVNRDSSKRVTIIVSPAPVFGVLGIENLQRQFGDLYSEDQEAWGFNHSAFETFLHHIASYERVVCLSGDVHYSFSLAIKYWNERGVGNARAAFTQLCSSSLKNSDSKTQQAEWHAVRPPPTGVEFITWSTAGAHYESRATMGIDTTWRAHPVQPHVPLRWHEFTGGEMRIRSGSQHLPQSRYQLFYSRDTRNSSARPGSSAPTVGGTTAQQRAGYRQRSVSTEDHRTVVGQDVVSVVSFDLARDRVIHTIWLVPGVVRTSADTIQLSPYTVHETPLEVPEASDRRPGD